MLQVGGFDHSTPDEADEADHTLVEVPSQSSAQDASGSGGLPHLPAPPWHLAPPLWRVDLVEEDYVVSVDPSPESGLRGPRVAPDIVLTKYLDPIKVPSATFSPRCEPLPSLTSPGPWEQEWLTLSAIWG